MTVAIKTLDIAENLPEVELKKFDINYNWLNDFLLGSVHTK